MTLLPRGLKVHLALGYTDMRKGIDGLAMLVQAVLRQDPFSGHLFVFAVGNRGLVGGGAGSLCATPARPWGPSPIRPRLEGRGGRL